MPPHVKITREQFFKLFGIYPAPDAFGMSLFGENSLLTVYEFIDEAGDEVEFLKALYRL